MLRHQRWIQAFTAACKNRSSNHGEIFCRHPASLIRHQSLQRTRPATFNPSWTSRILSKSPPQDLASAQQAQRASTSTAAVQTDGSPRISGNLILSLPAEIRNIIYEYVLACPPTYRSITKQTSEDAEGSEGEPPFLRVASHQIRQEASPIYYYRNMMRMHIVFGGGSSPNSPKALAPILDDIATICGSKPFSSIDVTDRKAKHSGSMSLDELRPLLDLIRVTGMDLVTAAKHTYHGSKLSADVREVLMVAERAHSKGWNSRLLAVQFRKWDNKKIRETRDEEARRKESLAKLATFDKAALCSTAGAHDRGKADAERKEGRLRFEERPACSLPESSHGKDPAE